MTNSWPDDNAEYQASDINKILDDELRDSKPVLRPTDRKWNNVASNKLTDGTPIKLTSEPNSALQVVAKIIAIVIAVSLTAIVILALFGAIVIIIQFISGMLR